METAGMYISGVGSYVPGTVTVAQVAGRWGFL